jgi:hypothetical protein
MRRRMKKQRRQWMVAEGCTKSKEGRDAYGTPGLTLIPQWKANEQAKR